MRQHATSLTLGDYLEISSTRLLARFPFFGILVMSMPLEPSEKCATAATDGRRIYYNPEWFETLRQQHDDHVLFVLAHEVLHPALGHPWRCGERDRQKWNAACDLIINHLLKDAGLHGPSDGLYLGQTCKGVHFDLAWAGLSEEEIYMLLPDPPKQYLLVGDMLPPDDEGNSDANGGAGQTPPGQPGQKSTLAGSGAQPLEDVWRGRLIQAAHAAKSRGSLPAGIARLIDQMLHPQKDWRQVLAEFVQPCLHDYDWRKLDRRLLSEEIYLPLLAGERLENLVVALDTSGSIIQEELSEFFAELRGILGAYPQVRVTVMTCDAAVHQIWELDQDAPLPEAPAGGGGTSFVPVFEYIERVGITPSAVVFFTDGDGTYPDRDPGYPVLWVLTPSHQTPPWGRTTMLDDPQVR